MTLAYGVCVGPSNDFDQIALPGIKSVDVDAPVLVRYHQRSIFEAYNSMIDEALQLDVEGLVLIHDDVSIRDGDFALKITSLFSDPTVGIVGAIGASNLRTMEWWWFETRGRVEEIGRTIDFGCGTFDVDVVDGLLLAMSPVAMKNLRFDAKNFSGFHGYDADIGMQAKEAGLRVLVTDLDVFHDSVPGRIKNRSSHLRAGRIWRRKWRRTLADRIDYLKFLGTSRDLGVRQRILLLAGPAGSLMATGYAIVEARLRKIGLLRN